MFSGYDVLTMQIYYIHLTRVCLDWLS